MDIISNINKNDILDPLSVIIKLYIFSFKPIGTKISISNNCIYIQDQLYIQSFIRTLNRDTKNDVNILVCPIIYACKNYLQNSNNKTNYNIITEMYSIALNGLQKMKQTYYNNSITFNIDHLINIISNFIKNDNMCNTYISPNYTIKENVYNTLNNVWNNDRVNILFGYIKEINANTNDLLKQPLMESLEKFMNYMDLLINNLIINNTIEYSNTNNNTSVNISVNTSTTNIENQCIDSIECEYNEKF
jgi:hypothetical protein